MPHDWESDTRSLADCLKAWHKGAGRSRDWAAAELRCSKRVYDRWCAGGSTTSEAMIRRLMTLIDLQT